LDPQLADVEGRRAQHDLIDEHLTEWCAARTGDEIVELLWPAGVPVAKVMQPHRQNELAQLRDRGFFESVGHPVNIAAPHSTLPVRLATGPDSFHRTPAPLLGEHNREVLSALGVNDDELAALEQDGVIGTAPATGGRKKATR
jgi:crotonobetainyl-CoA:carnitine CoA-transferase CaiB-like acyl-CoA transferase